MADLSHHERTANAQQIYAPAGSRMDQVRAQSARLIENVIKAHVGKPEIDVYLAIGSVCPFGSRPDCIIWWDEAQRLMGDRKERRL